jgi:leucyl aminopeptidase
MKPVAFVLAVLLAALACEVRAERKISFAGYEAPASGTVVIAVRKDVPREGAFAELDKATNGALRRAVTAVAFKGKARKTLDLPGVAPYDRIVLVGIGKEEVTPRLLEEVGGLAGQIGAKSAAQRVELLWEGRETDAAVHLAFGAAVGQYTFKQYQKRDPEEPIPGEGDFVIRSPAGTAAAQVFADHWQPVSNAVKFARDLVTEPANELYPERFVERARKAFEGVPNVTIEVLDVPAMEKLGMGGILSVGKGSARPPRLMVVRYDGGRKGDAPLAFAGKGITFDSGGISLKENEGMWRMKYDMSGAAAVTATVLGLAQRRARVNAIALAALAENMPSGTAARPGDVVRTMSGKTFEIMSTDAEGRMVLSDAVWYAQKQFKPRLVIDIATLTGSIVTALGDDYAGLFTRDDTLATQLVAAGTLSGEDLWRMPLHESYEKDLESPIADLRSGASDRGAGSGIGAHFIGSWIEEGMPWAHLDIAGMAWREKEASPTVPKGASAFGIRLLDRFVRENYEK